MWHGGVTRLEWRWRAQPSSSDAVAGALLRVARRNAEVLQGKTLLLRSGVAGFTSRVSGRSSGVPVHCRVTLPRRPCIRFLFAGSEPGLRLPPRRVSRRRRLPSARDSHHRGSQRTSLSCIDAMPGTQASGAAEATAPRNRSSKRLIISVQPIPCRDRPLRKPRPCRRPARPTRRSRRSCPRRP